MTMRVVRRGRRCGGRGRHRIGLSGSVRQGSRRAASMIRPRPSRERSASALSGSVVATLLASRRVTTGPGCHAIRGSHVRMWLAGRARHRGRRDGRLPRVLGWSIGDAIYMTGITLTTVGYKEVRELDGLGRAWTVLRGRRRCRHHLRLGRDRRRGGPVRGGQRATGGEADGARRSADLRRSPHPVRLRAGRLDRRSRARPRGRAVRRRRHQSGLARGGPSATDTWSSMGDATTDATLRAGRRSSAPAASSRPSTPTPTTST